MIHLFKAVLLFVSGIIMRCKAGCGGNHKFLVVRSGAISNRPGTPQEDSLCF